jgi:hypothetical protein
MEGAERLLKPPLERLIPLKTPPFEPTPPAPLPARPSSLPESAPFQDILILEKEHQWTASTHVFPAAWPRTRLRGVQGRTKRFQPIHNLRPTPKGKEATVKEAEWLVAHQEGAGFIDLADPATYIDQDQLWVSVNRYAPVAPRARPTPGYTLVFSHATGLHKEVRSVRSLADSPKLIPTDRPTRPPSHSSLLAAAPTTSTRSGRSTAPTKATARSSTVASSAIPVRAVPTYGRADR